MDETESESWEFAEANESEIVQLSVLYSTRLLSRTQARGSESAGPARCVKSPTQSS
jgi:hypothetical protein